MKDYSELHAHYFHKVKKFGKAVGTYKLLKSDWLYPNTPVIRQDVKYSELVEELYGEK